jgi:hypothetical protein
MADLDDVVARLEAAAEELADLALDALRGAVDRGDTARPADERALTRARAAVERAIGILQAQTKDTNPESSL